MNYTIKRIASQLYKIRHWEIRSGSYEEIPNEYATWFIDPPYEFGGHAYKCSNKHIDFKKLGEWCLAREGQQIICENTKATWLPFVPMVQQQVLSGKNHEAIYTNFHTHYDNIQQQLF